ncbi:asparagine synthetase B, partial [bacterium]|nr:asparagine synthetase B [bacterium]
MKRLFFLIIVLFKIFTYSEIFIPMDNKQNDHLKAYGLIYNFLKVEKQKIKWVLNYRGGSFILPNSGFVTAYCEKRNITYSNISNAEVTYIENTVKDNNMEIVFLEKSPKIAVFTPLAIARENNFETDPWDDAVVLVLNYAEIPYDKIYIDDILGGKLSQYDWLHLHHEDFTGQFGKFYSTYRTAAWYIEHKKFLENKAKEHGFSSPAVLLKKVAFDIADYTSKGGFLFAMCSATDSLDIALSAVKTDIVPVEFDGTSCDPNYEKKLNFNITFAFKDFHIITDPNIYEFSDIDVSNYGVPAISGREDFFLFDFSAKQDPIPTMLCQDHQKLVHGFMGQTSTFKIDKIKDNVVIMGYLKDMKRAKYIYGPYGKGF